ncbi:uncharacterized protein LOC121427660 [Lytechinus variegatus]|uniref:uncharacterized protein LOC121427660 n=1 Tax=Lytechinus variegatus TaxID=7654 RepID=UPI001BB27944|nr:uncharacterized protein LOC121427660 [Lytechinus variegatus]
MENCFVLSFVSMLLGLIMLLSLAPSSSALRIANLTVDNITTTSVSFNWLIIELDSDNQTDLLRNYIRLQYSLNFNVGSGCMFVNETSKTFTGIQPYTSYFACVDVVRLDGDDDDDECNSDSVVVSQEKDQCVAFTTEFATWSLPNIAALGCAGGILLVAGISLGIQVVFPVQTLNETVDAKKMREWSKKKRTESVRDFLEAVDGDHGDRTP